ncbi:transposable element Tcb1 transposase [Trichonephila clavipes]|nr:transposable element Tcb1 transposase [Trichonephila clavipes]
MLTVVHRQRRLEFERQYHNSMSTERRQVLVSDESRFMLHQTDGRWHIRRETSESKHPASIVGTVRLQIGALWYDEGTISPLPTHLVQNTEGRFGQPLGGCGSRVV